MTEPTYDVKRAMAILNAAKENGMYPDPIPEDDQDKISEAERMVAGARQAAQVAEAAGPGAVTSLTAINAVLFEADVTGGSESVTPAAEPEPGSSPDPDPAQEVTPQAAEAGVETYVTGDGWLSHSDEKWIIGPGGKLNDTHIEVHLPDSKEMTVVPVGFLARRFEPSTSLPSQPAESPPESLPSEASPPSSTDDQPSGATTAAASSPPASSESQQPSQESQSPPSSDIPIDDDEGDTRYRQVLDDSISGYERAHLPIPPDVQSPPAMPEDLTKVGDLEARTLHSKFNACAGRAHYLVGIERSRRIDCKRAYNEFLIPAMRSAREQLGKDASVTEVTQLAEEADEVKAWRDREWRHSDRELKYKDLYDYYSENVKTLSRDWTMRSLDEKGS